MNIGMTLLQIGSAALLSFIPHTGFLLLHLYTCYFLFMAKGLIYGLIGFFLPVVPEIYSLYLSYGGDRSYFRFVTGVLFIYGGTMLIQLVIVPMLAKDK